MEQTSTLIYPSAANLRASAPSSPLLTLRSRSINEFHSSPAEKDVSLPSELTASPSLGEQREKPPQIPKTAVAADETCILFRTDLYARGETPRTIRRKVRTGELIQVARGWYANRPMSDMELLWEMQKILPADVVFAAETAGLFYGVDARGQDRPDEPFRLCILRPRGRRSLRRPGERCRSMMLEDEDVVVVGQGIRITSPVRTLCDIAMSERIDRATAVVEEFLRLQLVTFKELWEAIRVRRGRRGVKTLRRAVREADPQSESAQETAVRLRLKEAGLPPPSTQIEVKRKCGRLYRMDLGWRCGEGGVAVEYYGRDFHPEGGERGEADERRLTELAEAGWDAIVVRAEDMAGIEPVFERAVADALRARMGRRFRVGLREKWRRTRTNRVRNAWSRNVGMGWTLWEGRRREGRDRQRP
ncbi:hypothetical protein [Schaalia sp. Marseille-Q2122]|uniref:hypothetical protein n=1 Tax=Schaalia sp. Marseille-Q2122 TaxID=2736604 RepID=UPI00158AC9B3|nr:hypothetical protein [Schaalia sp. Marseille-Q2122]